MSESNSIIVTGGGAAGFFAAVNIASQLDNPDIIILEKGASVLAKVKISGGGRCNVTNRISEPSELVNYYPRGAKELRGPFERFNTIHTREWFENNGVKLKSEPDGRIFPVSDKSASVTDCFLRLADRYKIKILTRTSADDIKNENGSWIINSGRNIYNCRYLIVTTGSSSRMWQILAGLGYDIITPVPSLFTFNIKDKRLQNLQGISVENAEVSIEGFNKIKERGPLLITHWGLSGPAILKLSSFAARFLYEKNYKFSINVKWTIEDKNSVVEILRKKRQDSGRKNIFSDHLFNLPSRLWEKLISHAGIDEDMKWSRISNDLIKNAADVLADSVFHVTGKSTFKEEFVTAGGIDLKNINFRTMESRLHKNLYFAGEVLNIDALTGGFNFQAAWTTAWIAANSIVQKII